MTIHVCVAREWVLARSGDGSAAHQPCRRCPSLPSRLESRAIHSSVSHGVLIGRTIFNVTRGAPMMKASGSAASPLSSASHANVTGISFPARAGSVRPGVVVGLICLRARRRGPPGCGCWCGLSGCVRRRDLFACGCRRGPSGFGHRCGLSSCGSRRGPSACGRRFGPFVCGLRGVLFVGRRFSPAVDRLGFGPKGCPVTAVGYGRVS